MTAAPEEADGGARLARLIAGLSDATISVRWNVCREMAKQGASASEALPALKALADSLDPTSAVWARYAIARIENSPETHLPYLIAALYDRRVFPGMAATALAGLGSAAAPALPDLQDRLAGGRPDDRWAAAWALGSLGPYAGSAAGDLASALSDPDEKLRWYAAWALSELGEAARPAAEALVLALDDIDDDVRGYAALALGAIGPPAPTSALQKLKQLADDENPKLSQAAETAISLLSPS